MQKGNILNMKKFLCILVSSFIALSAIPVLAEDVDPWALPLDIMSGGYAPDPACITENGYEDESISVRRETMRYKDVDFIVVWAALKSPTQLRTVCAGPPNSSQTALPTRMAKARNAVFAMNGEFYVQRTRDVFIYRQGEMYRNEPDPMKDILIIDENSDFHILTSEDKRAEIDAFLAEGHTIVNAFSFGPALVKDGEMCQVREDYFFDGQSRLARMAIGQVGPLSYVVARCKGKEEGIKGFTHQMMAEFMSTLGLQCAYNLDGGWSCVMIMYDKPEESKRGNYKYRYADWTRRDTEREQSDIIYFATAVKTD